MANKILTISIAAYNAEKYLEQALDSILIPEIMECLEVFIIDDGSTDHTYEIACEYEKKWQNVFHCVHKPNGGYGSTVNWSVEHASGTYLKLLDADDFFSKDGLKSLVEILKQTRADAVVSQASKVYPDGTKKCLYTFMNDWTELYTLPIEEATKYTTVAVWGYTFRTDIVRKYWKELPEHSFYTDRLFVLQALMGTNTIQYYNKNVYNYRVGIGEQSTSAQSIKKHYKEAINVDFESFTRYLAFRNCDFKAQDYVRTRLALDFAYTFCMFLELDINVKNLRELQQYSSNIKTMDEQIYHLAEKLVKRVRILTKTRYVAYFFWPILKHFRRERW